MIGRWAKLSQDAIKEATMVWCDSRGSLPSRSMPDEEKTAYMRIVDKHYPFGERSMFPYKAWLKERKRIVNWIYPGEPASMEVGLFAEDAS